MIGTTVSHYHVLGRLGAGAMGVVYEAEDLRLGRRVALKFLPEALAKDAQSLSRFEREARTASALNLPNNCTIFDVGQLEGSPFLVMERLEGETLRNRIAAGPLATGEFVDKATQIASAMAAAHEQRIVHRDLKPANIFITRSGLIKILDFGLAKPVHVPDEEATTVVEAGNAPVEEPELATIPGTVLGTLAYMAPEQIEGRPADPRSDVFALGVIFYEALTARRPFTGVDLEDLRRQITLKDPARPSLVNSSVPASIERLVLRCLDKRPSARFASAVDLLRELAALDSGRERRAGDDVHEDDERRGSSPIDAIAVLPFAGPREDPDSEYLAAGLTEGLIRSLSRLPGLRVKARSVVSRYEGQTPSPQAVGSDLDVDAAVIGSLGRRADQLSVSVDFVHCGDGTLLWGERFVRGADQLASIEEDVSRRVVAQIAARLEGATPDALPQQHTPNADAHHLYLRGRYHWNDRTAEALQRAIECFNRAVEADPCYALAFAGLADAYSALAFYDFVPASDVMPRAKAAAQRAVDLDARLPEGHASLGLVSAIGDFRWAEAGEHLRQALDLNPSLAYVHHWYAMQLSTLGRGDEAYAEIKRALELDPLAPAARLDALNILIRARRHEECISAANRALRIEPGTAPVWAALGRANYYSGRTAEAMAALEKAVAIDPESIRLRSLLAWAQAACGREEAARATRAALLSESASRYVPPFWLGVVELGLQQTDAALDRFEQALAERYPQVAYLAVEPVFDTLRAAPRFADLLRRINLRDVTQPEGSGGAERT